MTRVLTIFDLIFFLFSLIGNSFMVMARSHHRVLGILLFVCFVMMALTVFLTYRCVQISKLRNPYILDELTYQSEYLYNELSANSMAPLGNMPALTVHYMWCRKSHFEYKHYLSILSVAKVLKPDQIVLHYLEMPQVDKKGYFSWFDDIQREVIMLSLKQIRNVKYCSHDFSKGVNEGEDFPNADGIFMMEDIAITNLSREAFYHHTGLSKFFKQNCEDKINGICPKPERKSAQLFLIPSSEPYNLDAREGSAIIECPTIDTFNKANSSVCLQISQRLFPSDIWLQNKKFDRFSRKIIFNNSEPVRPVPNSDLAAPKIAHVLNFNGEETLSPLCFASIQSAFISGELKHVFVHGTLERSVKNPLWIKLVEKFPVTHIPTPGLDYRSSAKEQLLYGMHVLLQYGGILLNCDTIIQKPLHQLLEYPCVSMVKKSIYRIVHHHVDFSVIVARPMAEYLQALIPVLKQLVETSSERDFGAVACHVYEQYPSSVYMNTNLVGHLTCKFNKCLPSEGQLDVRQAFAVKLTWVEGSLPLTLQDMLALSTPIQNLMQSLGISVLNES